MTKGAVHADPYTCFIMLSPFVTSYRLRFGFADHCARLSIIFTYYLLTYRAAAADYYAPAVGEH